LIKLRNVEILIGEKDSLTQNSKLKQ